MLKLNLKLRRRDLSKQIETQIRKSIVNGTLQPGDELPPVKELAAEYGINHQTILKAYAKLKQEKLLESFRGSNARIAGASINKEILVVFDIASFSRQLSPGYQAYFKRMTDLSILDDVRISGSETTCKVRLSPLLVAHESCSGFLESPLLSRVENDRDGNIIGLLIIGYAASSRMQTYLNRKGIPFVGIGSTGQYPCQTVAPFLELISSGLNYAAKSKFKDIAFVYPHSCGIDYFESSFRATVKALGLRTRKEWIIPIQYATPVSEIAMLDVLEKISAKQDKLFILSADDAATLEILKRIGELNLSIPNDIGLFSFWSKEAGENPSFKFPKVVINNRELFDGALQLLLDLINGRKSAPCTVTVSSEIQLYESAQASSDS